jgi:hypothetical protein
MYSVRLLELMRWPTKIAADMILEYQRDYDDYLSLSPTSNLAGYPNRDPAPCAMIYFACICLSSDSSSFRVWSRRRASNVHVQAQKCTNKYVGCAPVQRHVHPTEYMHAAAPPVQSGSDLELWTNDLNYPVPSALYPRRGGNVGMEGQLSPI